MTDLTYLNFDLQIEQTGAVLRAQVLESPAGQAQYEFDPPFSPQELEALEAHGSLALGEEASTRQLGERLFRAVFAGEVYACLRASLRVVQAEGRGLRLRLRLTASLVALPWECLYDPQQGRFLALSTETPIARYIELPHVSPSLAVKPPLRILALLAGLPDLPALDIEGEWRRLQTALEGPIGRNTVILERLEPPSLGALQRYLRRGEVHIFHFVGHGTYWQGEGALLLQDEAGERRECSGAELAAVLSDHRPLRLALLNACEGARTASPSLFSGVAQALVRQKVPAVIAMQIPITDRAALVFTQDFYTALVDGYPVDAALSEARKAIYIQGSGVEWAAPVYFTRAPEGRLLDLAAPAEEKRPATRAEPGPAQRQAQGQHVFISYRHNTQPDERLAELFYQELRQQGHLPFIDRSMVVGTAWLDEIDQQLRQSDFLVVLLSHRSADSEMVKAEIRRAYQYQQRQGKPRILPVRLGYADQELLPYAIEAFLDPVQYVSWWETADDRRVVGEVIGVVAGGQPPAVRPPAKARPLQGSLSEDGSLVSPARQGSLVAPLPEFDPRFLDELRPPGGALQPDDAFYIERQCDQRLRRELLRAGSTVNIIGSRQVGKSSLLARGLNQARQQARLVRLDLQAVDRPHFQDAAVFLKFLAQHIARKTQFPAQTVERLWQNALGPQDNLTKLMEEEVLPAAASPLILALDEADRLLETGFGTDFFALLRAWHNTRALDDLWANFNLVLVISTEPYLLIADPTQSPFNVGLKLTVEDFTPQQVQELNRRHGEPLRAGHFERFMSLLNGHPYLTRKALYTLVAEGVTWEDLLAGAASDHGPFGDHLRHQLWLLRDEPRLQDSLRQVIRSQRCSDDDTLFRLQRAGLVKVSGEACTCRCELYSLYFKDKLR